MTVGELIRWCFESLGESMGLDFLEMEFSEDYETDGSDWE